ncbi:ATP-dependent DNA helicase RecG [bacterium BMS3Abin09]|nr:ATP-dependent DNA helicase RecG [bacterium BMS3Abin09]GBE41148.1 ATP-dependent DNA helicase RecG [bacterium BMS3Bbin09]
MKSNNKDLTPAKTSEFRNPQISKDTPVQYIKGVGPARARLLERIGITTLQDILFYFPWRYEDRKNLIKICDLKYGADATVMCEVESAKIITTRRKRMKIFEVTFADETGYLKSKWFNQAYLEKYFKKGVKVILSGLVKGNLYSGEGLEMDNPDYELVGTEDRLIHTSRIVPVYKATEGISQKQLRTLMFNAVDSASFLLEEYLPGEIIERNGLKPLEWSVSEAHFPEEYNDIDSLNKGMSPAHKRLIFDEFFLLEAGLALLKKRETLEKGISFGDGGGLVDKFLKQLHFTLTSAQERVLKQIRSDMKRNLPMNRLIHGDVGCGKTVVALISILVAVENGYQACLMAPTELLAEQHFTNIHKMVEALGLNVLLLTSSSGKKAAGHVSDGSAQVIIGTHAVIQEHVEFKKLGLAIIDEQHRFGVVQRAALRRKGANPDILIMTATPIPRTLAMTLYGDLDVSVIDELPAGRRPVVTKTFFSSQKEKIYSLIEGEMSKGRQVYIVYPLIEESEKLDLKSAVDGAGALKNMFPEREVGLVHGRMHHDEREAVMASFKSGDVDILVATTVIEVGIDVPNASLMLIVHAERFGLAQLHQLRGRIGRGGYDSYCLLLAYHPFSEDAKRRLKAMESTADGFRIAEEDLSIRGPGEFFGTRQSGIPNLQIANIIRDIDMLEIARKEAFDLVDADPVLKKYPLVREALQKKWMGRLELIKS